MSPGDKSSNEEDGLRLEKRTDEKIELRQRFTIYQQKVREEVDVMNHLLKGATAAQVFGLLKYVTALFICNGSFERSRDAIWMRGRDREPKDPKNLNDYTVTRGMHENCFYKESPGGSEALINGINSMGRHLVSLTIFGLAYTTFHPTMFPGGLASDLPKLKSLQLNIITEDRESCCAVMKHGCLKSFIGGLKALEELGIQFDDYLEADWEEDIDLTGPCFNDIIPPDISGLSSVEFRFMELTETGFIAFLLNNAKTLRSVRLDDVCFDNSEVRKSDEIWQNVFKTIRSHLQLRSIYIRGELLMEQLQYGVHCFDWLKVYFVEQMWCE